MDTEQLLSLVEQAQGDSKITPKAAENIETWLTQPRYADYAAEVAEHITSGKWQELDDAFWTTIPFGTGGRRGKMYPIGSNAINDRTIGESAQGLATYVKAHHEESGELSSAIAYDTRHRSPHFAQLCSEIMVAAGFKVYFLEGFRSTPELSYLVRYKSCSCGIMVTASHNPPSDNAVKAYWSTGGQLLPPHDKGVIDEVGRVEELVRTPFDEALADGRIVKCQEEVDAAFIQAVLEQSTDGPRGLKVIYSPLHGVGGSAVSPVLAGAGFEDVEVFGPHAEPDGDFPNVPGHVSNPENPQVFDAIVEHARAVGADIAVASDPDCDRIGVSAPLTPGADSSWETLSGNQIGALLGDYVLETRRDAGLIDDKSFVITTLVTTNLLRRIADSYGVRTFGDLLVGFKWIAGVIDAEGPEGFLYGTEESHGYMAGKHVRDKDGAVAALLLCELSARLKADGQTLHQKLDALFWQHGAHAERTISVQMPGSEGMARMKEVMASFRSAPPSEVGGMAVAKVRDYLNNETFEPGGSKSPLEGPTGDLVLLDFSTDGNYVAIRPSGTEPKIKLYMFAYEPAEQLADLEETKSELQARLDAVEASLRAFSGV
ncbi:MAG: phospho-sugar mutase [Planctomycetota bacterium]